VQDASYYRGQADRAYRLARAQTNRELEDLLLRVSRDYRDIAEDLETGAIDIRHPELMPQQRH
jgi:hypothetical protein